MSNTVFILGAGASKQAGAPLMNEFLDTARALWKSGQIGDAAESFKRVFQGISELQQVHSKSQLDIQNVESVFAAFEMGKTLKKFGSYSPDQIEDLIKAMRQVIVQTIETTVKLPVGKEGIRPVAAPPYGKLASLIHYLREEAKPRTDVSLVTFNYDMAVDYSFYVNNIHVDYGLGKDNGDLPVLKLHGSLNWAYCSTCEKVIPWYLHEFFKKRSWQIFPGDDRRYVTLNIGSQLDKFTHCNSEVHKEPVIVPPTWNKTEYHQTLSQVWSRAASELSDAENIFVIGYSLPESDAFFRYLYALGTVGKTPLTRFWVFNPDKLGKTRDRFEKLLGPGAQVRFRYFPVTFETSIGIIKEEFPGRD